MTTKTEIEDIVSSWTNLQQQFWDSFILGKRDNTHTGWEDVCKRPLEISQDALTNMLQSQAKFTHNILRYANPDLAESEVIDQYFDSVKEMLDAGVKTQEGILENWFSMTREFEKQTSTSAMMPWYPLAQQMNPIADWSTAYSNVFRTWKDTAEKALNAQNEFVSHLVPIEKAGTSSTKKHSTRTRKSTSEEARSAA